MAAKINLTTGKIIGCEEGSFAWWHEKGHLEYDNSEKGIKNKYRQEMSLFSAVTFGILSALSKYMFIFAGASLVLFWFYFLYEELWCNKYAKEKLGEKNE